MLLSGIIGFIWVTCAVINILLICEALNSRDAPYQSIRYGRVIAFIILSIVTAPFMFLFFVGVFHGVNAVL